MEPFWMCFVQGGHPPVKVHETYDAALDEAERLAKLPDNIGREVHILVNIACIRATISTSVYTVRQP